MSFKTFAAGVAACASLLTAMPAAAQFAKAEDAIKYRQSSLFVLGQHFGRLGAMANGKIPFDAKLAEENATIVAHMAALPWAGFGPGTDKGAPHKTKPGAWTEQAKFTEYAESLKSESAKLAAAAKTGKLEDLKAAFGPTASSCKTCHDAYRAR